MEVYTVQTTGGQVTGTQVIPRTVAPEWEHEIREHIGACVTARAAGSTPTAPRSARQAIKRTLYQH